MMRQRLVLSNLTKTIDTRLGNELRAADVDVVSCHLDEAYAACKEQKPMAVIYFSAREEVEDDFDPQLRRIQRDFRGVLIYVISTNLAQRLSLLADDHVEAVFPRAPAAEHLLTVIQQARQLHQKAQERSTPRYPVQFKCMIKVVGFPGLVEGEVSQLGRGGFMATLPQSPSIVPPGDQIRFTISQPDPAADIRIEGDGDIRWGMPTNSGGVQFGVKFTKLPSPSEEQLLHYINKLRTTPLSVGAL